MNTHDVTITFVAVAACAVAAFYYQQSQNLESLVDSCFDQYTGFKEGVIYGR